MAQCVGYLLAPCGPTLAGKLHDLSGGWTVVLAIGVILAAVMAVFGVRPAAQALSARAILRPIAEPVQDAIPWIHAIASARLIKNPHEVTT
jgi:MFS family permease